jgi:hypothetical protein
VANDWYQTADELIQDVRRLSVNASSLGLPQLTADALVLKLFAAINQGIAESGLFPALPFDPNVV